MLFCKTLSVIENIEDLHMIAVVRFSKAELDRKGLTFDFRERVGGRKVGLLNVPRQ